MTTQTVEKTKQIGFRGTLEYRQKLQRAALDRGIKVQELLEMAVETYLHPEIEPTRDGTAALAKLPPHWVPVVYDLLSVFYKHPEFPDELKKEIEARKRLELQGKPSRKKSA